MISGETLFSGVCVFLEEIASEEGSVGSFEIFAELEECLPSVVPLGFLVFLSGMEELAGSVPESVSRCRFLLGTIAGSLFSEGDLGSLEKGEKVEEEVDKEDGEDMPKEADCTDEAAEARLTRGTIRRGEEAGAGAEGAEMDRMM